MDVIKMNTAVLRGVITCLLICCWHPSTSIAQSANDEWSMTGVSLGTPPSDQDAKLSGQIVGWQDPGVPQADSAAEVNGLTVSPSDRGSVVNFYENVYLPVFSVPINWTGNPATCDAGTTSQAYTDASFDLINYYRAMVKLPPVANDVTKNASSQEAALMMSVNYRLSHSPTDDWECYTLDGRTAAGRSNIALGATGPRAIDLYIRDPGGHNTAVGHRRWILSPTRASFGIGSVGGGTANANALWVIAASTTRPATDIVAWPPRGFVPFRLVYPRWSFSLNNSPGANYSSATVSMHEGGVPVTLNIVSSNQNGYGDNTLVWEPSGLVFSAGQADRVFDITVSNIGNADQSEYSYRVTVIDPAMEPPGIFSGGFE
jgi:uncharacterized protein YkwD